MQLFHLRFNIPHPATHVPPIGSKTITHCNICKNETVSEIHADHNMGVDILENVDIPSVHIFFFVNLSKNSPGILLGMPQRIFLGISSVVFQ